MVKWYAPPVVIVVGEAVVVMTPVLLVEFTATQKGPTSSAFL